MSDNQFEAEYLCKPATPPRELVKAAEQYITATDAFDIAMCGSDGIPKNPRQSAAINANAAHVMRVLSERTGFARDEIRGMVRALQKESRP